MLLRHAMLPLTLVFYGCVPDFLARYQRDPAAPTPTKPALATPARPPGRSLAVVPIGKTVFRFQMPFEQVWDASLSVVMRNYNITIVDRENGVITTEWDSFYVKSQLFRNKVSLRVKTQGKNTVDVIVYNNVETLKSGQANETSIWAPHDKGQEEVGRLIHNIALVLHQDPPHLPSEMTAGAGEDSGTIVR